MKKHYTVLFGLILSFMAAGLYAEESYYQEVGVDPSATSAEISSKCRKEMFKYHPDKNPGNAQAEEKFKEINNACEILKDDTKRRAYDASLKVGTPASGNNRGSTLAIEGPAAQEKPQGWLDKVKSKVQSTAKGKEEKIINIVGDLLGKIPIPNQSKTIFNQNLALKDMAFVKAPSISGAKGGLGIKGSMQFNQFTVSATLYAILDNKDNKQVSLEIELPDQYSIVDMFPSLNKSVIKDLTMPKGRFILTSIDYTSQDWSVKKGFNFAAILDLSGPLKVIDDLRKKAASMPGVIATGGNAIIGGVIPENIQNVEFQATIPLKIGVDFTKISKIPKSVTDVFKQIYTQEFYVKAVAAKQQLEAGGSMRLVLGTQPQPLDFVIQGSIERQMVKIAGNMNGMLELKWVAIGDLGLQIDIDQSVLPVTAAFGVPFTGVGLRGKVDLGKKGDKRAHLSAATKLSLKGSDMTDLVVDLEGTNLHIDDFVMFLSQVAKKQGISHQSISKNKMPTLKIETVKGYMSTADTQIGTKEYKTGFELDIKGNLFDHTLDLYMFLDPNPKNIHMKGKGYISPIDLKIIKLSGGGCKSDVEKREGMCCEFEVHVAKPQDARFFLDGKLEIPKLDVDVSTKLDFEGTKFNAEFDSRVQDFFEAGFKIGLEEKKLEAFKAEFHFKGDFGKFMNNMVLPEVRKLNSTAVTKAQEADRKWQAANREWKKKNEELKKESAALKKHQADVRAFETGPLAKARAVTGSLANAVAKGAWKKYQEDRLECARVQSAYRAADRKAKSYTGTKWFSGEAERARGHARVLFFEQAKCVKQVLSGKVAADAQGVAHITQAAYDAAEQTIKAYKQATEAVNIAKKALAAIDGEVNKLSTIMANAEPLKKTTQAVTGVFEKLVEVIAAGAQIINVKEVSGSTSGTDLKNLKLPQLNKIELAIQIPTQVPKIGGQSKTFKMDGPVYFDFKNPKSSAQSIAKAVGNAIKDMVK